MADSFLTFSLLLLFFFTFSIAISGLQSSHTVDVHSLVSSDICSSPKGNKGVRSVKPRLTIVDRHGPCSASPHLQRPSLEQILSADQSRVDSIHRIISGVSSESKNSDRLALSKITAQYGGSSFGGGLYVVSIGIGTPQKNFTLSFDTGSDVTWIQCKPCRQCYPQKEALFDPSQSSTFAYVSCNSDECRAVSNNSCSGSSCLYGVRYYDQSYTIGYYAKDTLMLTPDVIRNFRFGCGQYNQGTFGKVAGLLGLSPGNESLVLQTSDKYQRVFSYCLPPPSSTGYLDFGRSSNGANTKRTPIPKNSSSTGFYYLNMIGLSVAGKTLQISSTVFSNAWTIIDSGTTFTQLPPDAYKALSSAFREHMTQYKMAPSASLFDTCYNFKGLKNVTIPTVGVQFLNNVSLNLDPSGILFGVSTSQVCLAFASNSDPSNVGFFGNVQQRTFNVVYDVANGEIGFSPKAC